MKKLSTILLLLFGFNAIAQTDSTKNLHLFKFNFLQLINSSLSFSYEGFNAENSRSWQVNFGVRYRTDDSYSYAYGNGSDYLGTIENFNDWKGLTLALERRMYIPRLQNGKDEFLMSREGKYGVYFAPALRFDYNHQHYDNSFYEYIYNPQLPNDTKQNLVTDKGKISYLGVMPSMNIGIQFTIFREAYIDCYLGGGLRFQSKNVINQARTPATNGYRNNYPGLMENLVVNEGVMPTGGITIGVPIR